jgi:outer membrane cobalamin receptor
MLEKSHVRLLAVALTVAALAFAQDADPPIPTAHLKDLTIEELMAVEVSTVTTPSRREERAHQALGTVIVIDRRQIERRGYMTLVDVLRDLPGIDTTPLLLQRTGNTDYGAGRQRQ